METLQTILNADGSRVENAQAATRFVILSGALAEEGMREVRNMIVPFIYLSGEERLTLALPKLLFSLS